MATIREVSRHAQVSVATVSRVVNGSKWVAETTRQRVLDAMAELGYQPNAFARSLATNKSDTIGMVVGDLTGPFFGPLMQSAERVIRQAGKHLIVTAGHATLEDERDAVEFLLKRRCDALIVHLDRMPDEDVIQLFDREPTPIILENRLIPEWQDRCIRIDNEAGGYLATRHLLELGHRQIAHITGPLYKADARDRLAGYRRALEEAGIGFDEHAVVEGDFLESGGARALQRLWQRKVHFTALFCGNDLMAIGAMNRFRHQGMKVPEHCSIIGYDDVLMSSYVEPALTTIRVPVEDIGTQAAQLALSVYGQTFNDVQRCFSPELIVRQSAALRLPITP
ncbi:MAG: LacI family DNA-binding transcriptional regulator [Saccharospirillum sp.]